MKENISVEGKIKNIPQKVFLQLGEVDDCKDFDELRNTGQISWNDQRVFENDIEYALALQSKGEEQNPCNFCGKTLRDQLRGCLEVTCYRQFFGRESKGEEGVDKAADKKAKEIYTINVLLLNCISDLNKLINQSVDSKPVEEEEKGQRFDLELLSCSLSAILADYGKEDKQSIMQSIKKVHNTVKNMQKWQKYNPAKVSPVASEELTDDFENLFNEFTAFSVPTFENASSLSSLEKCDEEIREIANEINHGHTPSDLKTEYVDAIMCLLDSSARAGITIKELKEAFKTKLEINKNRTWVKNANNTYSHF